MAENTQSKSEQLRVVCLECAFSNEVEKSGDQVANVLVEHGRKTGHKLTTENVGIEGE